MTMLRRSKTLRQLGICSSSQRLRVNCSLISSLNPFSHEVEIEINRRAKKNVVALRQFRKSISANWSTTQCLKCSPVGDCKEIHWPTRSIMMMTKRFSQLFWKRRESNLLIWHFYIIETDDEKHLFLLTQLQGDIRNRAPTYLRDLIGRLSTFSDEPRLAGLVGLVVTMVMDMVYTSSKQSSLGKGRSAGSSSCQVKPLTEVYTAHCILTDTYQPNLFMSLQVNTVKSWFWLRREKVKKKQDT